MSVDGADLKGKREEGRKVRKRRTDEKRRRDSTRLSYAIANYWQFDPVITQFKVIGPRRALAPRESFVCIKAPHVRTHTYVRILASENRI